MLGELEKRPDRVVIADFEAGVGTMLRADAGQVDVAVIVVEPYMKSIETAKRLVELVEQNQIGRHVLVANKIRDEEDLLLVRKLLGGREPDLVVPADDAIAEADLRAEAPMDRDPDSPGVAVLREFAARFGSEMEAAGRR